MIIIAADLKSQEIIYVGSVCSQRARKDFTALDVGYMYVHSIKHGCTWLDHTHL